MYGDCEELLGKWFQRSGKRSEVKVPGRFWTRNEEYDVHCLDRSS